MTNSVNISLDQIVATQAKKASSNTGSKGLSGNDLSNFINTLASLLGDATGDNLILQNNLNLEQNNLTLAVNLASQLQEQGLLPDSMKDISLGELSHGILYILNSENLLSSTEDLNQEKLLKYLGTILEAKNSQADMRIKPSLITDLTNTLEANNVEEINDNNNDDILLEGKSSLEELVETLLNAAQIIPSTSDIAETISQIDDTDTKDEFISDILLKLSTEADQLGQEVVENPQIQIQLVNSVQEQLSTIAQDGSVTKKELSSIKDNVISQLKALGLSDDEIKNQLIDLSKNLNKPIANGNNNLDISETTSITTKAETTATASMLAGDGGIKSASLLQNKSIGEKVSGMGVSGNIIQSMADGEFSDSSSNFTNSSEGSIYDLDGFNNTETLNQSTNTANSFTNYLSSTKGSIPTTTTQMIAVQIQKNAGAQISKMKIQLMPEELGKLDINLQFDKDGSIKAHLVAEKSETLSMLQKDSNQLQKILQDAGFNVSQDSLSFDLQQNSQDNLGAFKDNNQNAYNKNFASSLNGEISLDDMVEAQIAIQATGYINSRGVNIQV